VTRLNGKTALITGSTDGVGRLVAKRLGDAGTRVLVHGRNRERGERVVVEIKEGGGSAEFLVADLSALAEVRRLAEAVQQRTDRLDILINNAGIGTGGSGAPRQTSADGYELRFAVNYLAGFLLTHLLLPLIKQSAPARIVNVASAGQQAIDFTDVMLTRGYSGTRAYCQSKLAQIMFTFESRWRTPWHRRHGQRPASGDLYGHDHGTPGRHRALEQRRGRCRGDPQSRHLACARRTERPLLQRAAGSARRRAGI
jgi:NAD(P)-dependent dehydrogenase (short-subunit alcohol dehydrogenase family)